MNIKVAAFTVSDKSSKTIRHDIHKNKAIFNWHKFSIKYGKLLTSNEQKTRHLLVSYQSSDDLVSFVFNNKDMYSFFASAINKLMIV